MLIFPKIDDISKKANFSSCETAGLDSLKGVLEVVCGLKFINLTTENIKILYVHFSYNFTLKVGIYSKKHIVSTSFLE